MTIGLMLLSLVLSLFIFLTSSLIPSIQLLALSMLASIDFNATLMGGMLSFLLFAGALHVDLNDLLARGNINILIIIVRIIIPTPKFPNNDERKCNA